jgi:DNA mismatch endonuclease (patch repair protein)
LNKFASNVARDRKVASALRGLGWRVKIIWACEIEKPGRLEKLEREIRRGYDDIVERRGHKARGGD